MFDLWVEKNKKKKLKNKFIIYCCPLHKVKCEVSMRENIFLKKDFHFNPVRKFKLTTEMPFYRQLFVKIIHFSKVGKKNLFFIISITITRLK